MSTYLLIFEPVIRDFGIEAENWYPVSNFACKLNKKKFLFNLQATFETGYQFSFCIALHWNTYIFVCWRKYVMYNDNVLTSGVNLNSGFIFNTAYTDWQMGTPCLSHGKQHGCFTSSSAQNLLVENYKSYNTVYRTALIYYLNIPVSFISKP